MVTSTETSSIITKPFGGNGGSEFSRVVFTEIGLRSGSKVDQIRLDNIGHGGSGGSDRGSITLASDEYISKVEIRSGKEVDAVTFTTNKGNSIGGGGTGGGLTVLNGIRVMAIGGRCGKRVDKLDIMYINNYQPSVVQEKQANFILSFSAPFETFEKYESSYAKTVDSYQKVTEQMLNQTYSASVEGEYYIKATASTQIDVKDSTLETVNHELTQELTSSTRTTQTIPEGYVGIFLASGTLMKGADGNFWMYPTGVTSYAVIKTTEADNLLNHYDLTGQLHVQMSGLQQYKKIKNGYVYYSK
jgi:hypothetical protein